MTIGNTFTLNNQVVMPDLRLGCYKAHGDEIYQAVRWAIEAGYRMVDTASRYENEQAVGRGVRESSVPREELFVVSKLWPTSCILGTRSVNWCNTAVSSILPSPHRGRSSADI